MEPAITGTTNALPQVPDLPNEIISRILEELIPNRANPQPPWYIGHICSRWRDVALATPALWSVVIIHFDRGGKKERKSFEIASELFCRSGQSHITYMIHRPNFKATPIAYAFDLPTLHASRVRHLIIDRVERISDLACSVTPFFTSLETLEISLHHWTDAGRSVPESINLFNKTPNLRRVVLSTKVHSHPEWSHQNLTFYWLPWAQLTHLHILGFRFASWYSTHMLLTMCFGLEECSFSIPFDRPPWALPIVTLAHLHTLNITKNGPGEHGQFLRYVALPSLKRLTLPADPDTFQWSQRELVELIGRSGCRIEEFTLTGSPTLSFLLALLGEMPSLVRLTITEPSFLQKIIGPMLCDGFLPALRVLECRVGRVDSTVAVLRTTFGEHAIRSDEPADDVRLCVVSLVTDSAFEAEVDAVVRLEELQLGRLRFKVPKGRGLRSEEAVDVGSSDDCSSSEDDADS